MKRWLRYTGIVALFLALAFAIVFEATTHVARGWVRGEAFYEGRPIGIQMPSSLTLEVADTTPVMKTATKTASTKPARLSNGVTVNVPEFIQTGERIRVNPETGEYLDRAKE